MARNLVIKDQRYTGSISEIKAFDDQGQPLRTKNGYYKLEGRVGLDGSQQGTEGLLMTKDGKGSKVKFIQTNPPYNPDDPEDGEWAYDSLCMLFEAAGVAPPGRGEPFDNVHHVAALQFKRVAFKGEHYEYEGFTEGKKVVKPGTASRCKWQSWDKTLAAPEPVSPQTTSPSAAGQAPPAGAAPVSQSPDPWDTPPPPVPDDDIPF